MKQNILLLVAAVALAIVFYSSYTKAESTPKKNEGFVEDSTKTVVGAIFGGGVLVIFVGFMLYAMMSGPRR